MKKTLKKKRPVKKRAPEKIPAGNPDLSIARKIQAAMIPRRLPSVEGIDIATLYLPCSAVGGDLFDIVQISDDVLAFLIFDVTGHGVSSALLSAMAKVCFSNHIRMIDSPRAVIERVNTEIIHDISADFFLTAFVGFLDLRSNKLTYSNAGHTYPIIYRKGTNQIIPLRTQGTFIGIFENGFYEEHSVFLNPGDWLVLFTDGLYRLYNERDAFEGRLLLEKDLIEKIDGRTPQSLLGTITARHKKIKNGVEDDITAIAVEILTESRRNQIKVKLGFKLDDPVYLQAISYFEEMDRAASVVLSSMDSFGYADESIRKMKITLTELLVNAIHHGNSKDFSKKVTIGHMVDREKTVISIMDEGEGFTPDKIPDPTLPENLIRDCGRGLYIVSHYTDKLEFNEKGNRVTITKYHTVV
jgi:anti-sigma regulatory factor (Ser/Thr protein kinase)